MVIRVVIAFPGTANNQPMVVIEIAQTRLVLSTNRLLVETTMGRYKTLIGPRLRARGFAAQQTEAAIGVAVLNRMLVAGRPDSVRRQPVTA
ncbi:MAG: family transposase [Rhodopila sp.]|jgi:hypothetical protein|nr:family transposase [Rhodopila sp.]